MPQHEVYGEEDAGDDREASISRGAGAELARFPTCEEPQRGNGVDATIDGCSFGTDVREADEDGRERDANGTGQGAPNRAPTFNRLAQPDSL